MTRRARREKGQAIVEFSLVVLVFMIVVLGIVEAGRAVWNYNTLSNAVREGTRYAIVHGADSSTPVGPASNDALVEQEVEKFSSGLKQSALTVTSTWLDGANTAGTRVRVTATYQFNTIFSSVLGIPDISMSASSTMNITN